MRKLQLGSIPLLSKSLQPQKQMLLQFIALFFFSFSHAGIWFEQKQPDHFSSQEEQIRERVSKRTILQAANYQLS